MLKVFSEARPISFRRSLGILRPLACTMALTFAALTPGVAGEPGASPHEAPHGPGYAGYGKPNYYVGSRPSPPDYTYPHQIAPFPPGYYGPIPWSEAWYDYCLSRYRGFDPRTGYVRDASGARMFCR